MWYSMCSHENPVLSNLFYDKEVRDGKLPFIFFFSEHVKESLECNAILAATLSI